MSAHNGDLAHPDCYHEAGQNINKMSELLKFSPDVIAIDCHPDYHSARLGQELARSTQSKLIPVQHHHAHLVSCLVENQVADTTKVLGIILDGLGYGCGSGDGDCVGRGGDDAAILWGSEILLADYRDYQRLGHLRSFPLLGGDKANRQPWRNLLALLYQANLTGQLQQYAKYSQSVKKILSPDAQMLLRLSNTFPHCSSMGRLFDAVAALLDIAPDIQTYEGEAAAKLEGLALQNKDNTETVLPLHFEVAKQSDGWVLDPTPIWQGLLNGLRRGEYKAALAMAFHQALCEGLVKMLETIVEELNSEGQNSFKSIVLSGGVFQNQILLTSVEAALSQQGFCVYTQSQVPANDGGLALGQLAIALSRYESQVKSGCGE